MPLTTRHPLTLRPKSADYTVLLWAIGISLLVHSSGYGIYKVGDRYGLWNKLHTPQWVQKLMRSLVPPRVDPKQKKPDREPPLMFVEVNPANAVAEPPKNAKYYAAQNTQKSNPDADKETDVPKISGSQERIMRTEDTPRQNPTPLQPAVPQPQPREPEPKQNTIQERGDLTIAKAETASKPRPRTLAEVQKQNPRPTTAGEKAKQDGGVRRISVSSSVDAVGSPFGAYDQAMVAAIQQRWYSYLDQRSYASDGVGKVVIRFRLHSDGRVTDITRLETTVNDLLSSLCHLAISENSPYDRWPTDMRLMNRGEFRDLTFTFYYD